MKVYELMNILADMPSGADVFCGGSFTVKELKSCDNCGTDDNGQKIFSFAKEVESVDNTNGNVYIEF